VTLPRLLAYLDDATASRDDLGILLAAVAAHGPEVGIVARLPAGTTDALARLAARALANARPAGARVFVTGRADVAAAVGADGVIARRGDLPPDEMRKLASTLIVLSSVHTREEAAEAIAEGADGLVVGTIWATPTHPGRPGAGIALLEDVAALGLPTWAIGGITRETAAEASTAGAHGVAAIRAIWSERRPHEATGKLLDAVRFPPG
jgi:thiamine-phosphate pyrophosphorylase